MLVKDIKKLVSLFSLILVLNCLSIQSFAQVQKDTQEEPAVRISTELVQFDVVVEDSKGNIVKNLKAEDFEVYEDKERQEINNFSFIDLQTSQASQADSKAPANPTPTTEPVNKDLQATKKGQVGRTIAIVVDEIAIPTDAIETVRTTLKKFVDTQMLPTDLVAIVKTGATVGGLQQFTGNKQLLYAAIDEIKGNITNLNRSGLKSVPSLQISGGGALSTNPLGSFRTSVSQIKFVIEALKQLPGRKSLLLLSAQFPGVELANTAEANQELNSLIDFANRASVVCYANDVRGSKFLGVTAQDNLGLIAGASTTQNEEAAQFLIEVKPEIVKAAQEGLRVLASSTGGIFTVDPEIGVKTVLADQRGYYLIGYVPKKASFSAKDTYHKLSVKVKKAGLTVRTRTGFYSVDDKELKKTTPEQEIINAAISPLNTNKINVQMTPTFTYDKTEGNVLRSAIYIDCGNLSFADDAQGAKKLSLETIIYTFSQNGNLLNQVTHKNNITIPQQRYQSFLNSGFAYSLNTTVKDPGTYQLRIVVKDVNNNNLGTAGQLVVVPDTKVAKLSLSGIVLIDELNAKPENSNKQSALLALATRKFKLGSALKYSYHIYNPTLEPASKKPSLKIQTALYKDSKAVLTNDFALEAKDQENIQDIPVEGKLLLTEELVPGKYTFQVLVTDLANKNKVQTQEIEFEILGEVAR